MGRKGAGQGDGDFCAISKRTGGVKSKAGPARVRLAKSKRKWRETWKFGLCVYPPSSGPKRSTKEYTHTTTQKILHQTRPTLGLKPAHHNNLRNHIPPTKHTHRNFPLTVSWARARTTHPAGDGVLVNGGAEWVGVAGNNGQPRVRGAKSPHEKCEKLTVRRVSHRLG